jgi:hypothetical protein
MSIDFQCANCRRAYRVADSLAGKRVACKQCGQPISIPGAAQPAPVAAAHRIEVKVPGRDVRIRHTEGYRAKTAEQRMKERTLSALMFDVADNPLDVRVQLMPEQADGNRIILPVLVRVPISQLVLVPQENEHVARLSIVIAVRDIDGRLSDPQRVEVPISIPNEKLLEAMGQEVGHGLNIAMRKGDSKLAVGVRDELSAVESTLNLNVTVGKS